MTNFIFGFIVGLIVMTLVAFVLTVANIEADDAIHDDDLDVDDLPDGRP